MSSIATRIKSLRLRKEREHVEAIRNRVLPLSAYYGQKEDREARRAQFYAQCASQFKWDANRVLDPLCVDMAPPVEPEAGFGGRGRSSVKIDRTHSMIIDRNAAPFEFLSSSGLLKSKDDPIGLEQTRFSAGMRLRSLMMGAEPKGMNTVDLEAIGGGSCSGFSPTEYMIECMKHLERVRHELDDGNRKYATIWRESRFYLLLERLIYRDDWSVIEVPKSQRKAVVNAIHYGLDCLSLMWGFIESKEFSRRWG